MSKSTKLNHLNVREDVVCKKVYANEFVMTKDNKKVKLDEYFDLKLKYIDEKAASFEKLSEDMKKTLQEVVHLRNDIQLRQRQSTTPTTTNKKKDMKLADLTDVDIKGIKDGDTLEYKNKKFVVCKKE
jgi:hypothetical protein